MFLEVIATKNYSTKGLNISNLMHKNISNLMSWIIFILCKPCNYYYVLDFLHIKLKFNWLYYCLSINWIISIPEKYEQFVGRTDKLSISFSMFNAALWLHCIQIFVEWVDGWMVLVNGAASGVLGWHLLKIQQNVTLKKGLLSFSNSEMKSKDITSYKSNFKCQF